MADVGSLARYALARELCPGVDVLDLGAGDGEGAALLAGWGARSVVAADIAAFPEAEGYSRVRADACDPEALDALGEFGLVLALGMVESVADPLGLMRTVARRMAPGGVAVVTCPSEMEGASTAARAFSALAAPSLGKPAQVLFALPAAGLLLVDPERVVAPLDGDRPGVGDVHSTVRVGDLRPHLKRAVTIVGIWGGSVPETCVVTPVGEDPWPVPRAEPAAPEPPPLPPTPAPAPGLLARLLGGRGR